MEPDTESTFTLRCPRCSEPLAAFTGWEWACESCGVVYEPCGNYLIVRTVSLDRPVDQINMGTSDHGTFSG